MKRNIVVIGGGAAGMLAAVSAAERGASVTLLEPNERLGKKLNITGKGRCNLTNDADVETVLAHVLRNGRFLYSALSRFGPGDVMAFFEGLGVSLKVERGNRVFPLSDRAFDVSGALERRLRKLGVRRVRDRAVSIETAAGRTVPAEAEGGSGSYADRSANQAVEAARAVQALQTAQAVPTVCAVRGERDTYPADAVILASGGVSYPATGSTGEGHRIARSLGHTVTPLRGSLVPLCEAGNLCARMQGLSLRNVQLTVWEGKSGKAVHADGGKPAALTDSIAAASDSVNTADLPDNTSAANLSDSAGAANLPDSASAADLPDNTSAADLPDSTGAANLPDSKKAANLTGGRSAQAEKPSKEKRVYQGFGELLFTHFGVSGPLVLSASAHMRRFGDRAYRLEIDLKPALDASALDRRLVADLQKYANHDFANSLDDLLPRKMIPVMIELSGIPAEKKSRDITREERRRLLDLLKGFPVPVAGPRPVTEAIVTSGGVSVKEVDPATMASKRVKGLYFAGEILDVDAYTGGFNLQIAWSTGRAAGIAAAEQGDTL